MKNTKPSNTSKQKGGEDSGFSPDAVMNEMKKYILCQLGGGNNTAPNITKREIDAVSTTEPKNHQMYKVVHNLMYAAMLGEAPIGGVSMPHHHRSSEPRR